MLFFHFAILITNQLISFMTVQCFQLEKISLQDILFSHDNIQKENKKINNFIKAMKTLCVSYFLLKPIFFLTFIVFSCCIFMYKFFLFIYVNVYVIYSQLCVCVLCYACLNYEVFWWCVSMYILLISFIDLVCIHF